MKNQATIVQWGPAQECCDAEWEAAYACFETPEEEVRKFVRRLRGFGVERWDRNLAIVELFCGRGSGLVAWQTLGFSNVEGVDLSASLLSRYTGNAQLYLGDCRKLQLPDSSRDVVCVQGGMHHLPALPEDLAATVHEVRRVLRPGGRFVVVEPWTTPFLTVTHALARHPTLRRAWARLDALGRMIEREQKTYFNWLSRPAEILRIFEGSFDVEMKRESWGKLSWLGRRR